MDADRFDRLTRSLTATRSRRGALAALLGGPLGLLGLAGTAAKKRKKGKKKKKGQGNTSQNPVSPPPPPPPPCQGQADGAVCGAGRICAQDQCVTGQGTCMTGTDVCTGSAACGTANSNCFCFTSMANQTRCGINSPLSGCNSCASDAACAGLFPTIPGVFCFQDTGDNCACGGRCMPPCCHAQADGVVCGPGLTCQGGACACPTECCSNADCGVNQACQANGTCDCVPGTERCASACLASCPKPGDIHNPPGCACCTPDGGSSTQPGTAPECCSGQATLDFICR